MARRRIRVRKRKKKRWGRVASVVAVLACGFFFRDTWLGWFSGDAPARRAERSVPPPLTSDRPDDLGGSGGEMTSGEVERGDDPLLTATPTEPNADPEHARALMESAQKAMDDSDPVLARSQLTEAVQAGLAPKDELAAQVDLRRLGRETIFSKEVHDGDPHTGHYTIAVGDTLGKIADAHLVTPELLARINGLSNINMIQAGHRLKVVQGPFHVRVIKSAHALDVFLGESLVEHFKVGLGAEGATPTGEWVVSSKLKNPTYYSPRGDGIIQANDPKNPLGERWIGLQGVGGNALGQMRYGIHGTIEPESIGKNASLGCIRMYNEDAEFLYDLLVVGHSKVFVVD